MPCRVYGRASTILNKAAAPGLKPPYCGKSSTLSRRGSAANNTTTVTSHRGRFFQNRRSCLWKRLWKSAQVQFCDRSFEHLSNYPTFSTAADICRQVFFNSSTASRTPAAIVAPMLVCSNQSATSVYEVRSITTAVYCLLSWGSRQVSACPVVRIMNLTTLSGGRLRGVVVLRPAYNAANILR
jgi:hypothetical protein